MTEEKEVRNRGIKRITKRNLILSVVLVAGFMIGYNVMVAMQANQSHAGFIATGIGEYDYVNMYKYNGMNETLGHSCFRFSSYVGEDIYNTYPVSERGTATIYLQAQVFIEGNVYVGYIIADSDYDTEITIQGVYITIHYFEYKTSYSEFDEMMLFYCVISGIVGAFLLPVWVREVLNSIEKKRKNKGRN